MPADTPIALRLSNDAFLYIVTLAQEMIPTPNDTNSNSYPIVPKNDNTPLIQTPNRLFEGIDDLRDNEARAIHWKCVYTPESEQDSMEREDFRMKLMSGLL